MRKAIFSEFVDSAAMDACCFGKSSFAHSFAIKLKPLSCAAIQLLNRLVRPNAIPRFVVAVIVLALKGKACRTQAHVIQERDEVVQPCRTHLDSTSTVILETLVSWVVTATFCSGPSDMFLSARCSMRNAAGLLRFGQEAATTPRVAGDEIARRHYRSLPALAETFPCNFLAFRASRFGNNGQPTKRLSQQISFFHEGIFI